MDRQEFSEKVQDGDDPVRRRLAVRIFLSVFFVSLGTVFLFILAYVPPSGESFYPKCMSHTLTGLHCPGCGTTRALHALLNGQVRQALTYNLLIPVMVPLLAYHLFRGLFHSLWGGTPKPMSERWRKWSARGLWLLMILMVIYGILRNIPSEPFNQLAPHELKQ